MHNIRAIFNEKTIRVYQAYSPEIALPALKANRFVSPFKMSRMTWIKPSFNWMMYRCGYGAKPGQEMVLAIDILREGFEWALAHAAVAKFIPSVHGSYETWQQQVKDQPVRIQWDPERDWQLQVIPDVRSIQIGLSGKAVDHYVNDWTVRIENVTPLAHLAAACKENGTTPTQLPCFQEQLYPLNPSLAAAVCQD